MQEAFEELGATTSAPDLFPHQTLWPTVVAGARYSLKTHNGLSHFEIVA